MVGKQETIRFSSQDQPTHCTPVAWFMDAGRPTQQKGLGGTGSGDRQGPGESGKSNRAPGLAARGSFPRLKKIAATFGPANGLPMCIQFFRPSATGRMEFSARIVLSSNSGT